MAELFLETVKIDKISQTKRLLCYWYFYQGIQAESVSEAWNAYEKVLYRNDKWIDFYRSFFENPEIDDEKEILKTYDIIVKGRNDSLREELKDIWRKIKELISKEIDCEKKLYKILNKKAEDHPIISKIIIAVLSVILLGLIEDCIHDGIQMNSRRKNELQNSIYITDINNDCIQIIYENGEIHIDENIYLGNGQP